MMKCLTSKGAKGTKQAVRDRQDSVVMIHFQADFLGAFCGVNNCKDLA